MAKNDRFNEDEDLNRADEPTEENTRPDDAADLSEAEREHRAAEAEVFGENPMRGPDGSPMERGQGSRYAESNPEARTHYHVTHARVAAEEVLRISDQLKKAIETLHSRLVEARVVGAPPASQGP